MEIPAGKWCSKCPLCQYDADACLFHCKHPKFLPHEVLQDEVHGKIKGIDEDNWQPLRCPACLAAYPNGAVITITAKPSVAIGFIPKEQTVDPKTGVTTFTDIELLEVSEIKPK